MVTLNQTLYPLTQYGPVEPSTLTGPIRPSLVKFGDGLFIEEGTTNLMPTPAARSGTTVGFASRGGGSSLSVVAGGAICSYALRATCGSTGILSTTQTGIAYSAAVTAGTTYAGSCFVRPIGKQQSVKLSFDWYTAAGAFISTTNGPVIPAVAPGQWTRLAYAATAPANAALANVYGNADTAVIGDAMDTDGYQIEQKGYATSYCDGSLSTAWNAPGALATWDFEDGTTGGWTGSANGTLSNDTAQHYSGTKALKAAITSTAAFSAASPNTNAVTAGVTYSDGIWVRCTAARQARADLVWYNSLGAVLSTTSGTAITLAANTWMRPVVTAVAPANAAYVAVQLTSTDATLNDTYWVDAVRVSAGTDTAAYYWNGAENASTSTRTAGQLSYANPGVTDNYTVACLAKVNRVPASSENAQWLFSTNDGTYKNGTEIQYSPGNGTFYMGPNGTADARALIAQALTPGDLYLLVLTRSGSSTVAYLSRNGAAATSGTTTTANATSAANPLNILTSANAAAGTDVFAIEQVLVYNRALSASDVAALVAATNEQTFTSDPAIVFSAGSGPVRGTQRALTAAGTGYYRPGTGLPCYAEPITPIGINPDDDYATQKITVAAGSGIGQGQTVSLSASGTPALTVKRVFSAGGVYDEIYAA